MTCEWSEVLTDPPPQGRKILMLSCYGVALIGDFNPEWAGGFVTDWMYLPPKPKRNQKEQQNVGS